MRLGAPSGGARGQAAWGAGRRGRGLEAGKGQGKGARQEGQGRAGGAPGAGGEPREKNPGVAFPGFQAGKEAWRRFRPGWGLPAPSER